MLHKSMIAAAIALGTTGAFAASDAPTGWTKCVQNTGATCVMSGTHQVTLGKSGVFSTYKTITGSFVCSNTTFPDGPTSTSAWCSYDPSSGSSSSSSSSSVASSSSSSKASSSSSSVASSSSSSVASSSSSSVSSASSSAASSVAGGTIDAKTLTGASTPLQNVSSAGTYGVRNYSAPATQPDGLHPASNYKAAPAMPTWKFATVDPTGGKLTFEREVAPANGWASFYRGGKVTVTGGSSATANRIYTVFNGQQLVAALAEAGNDPKIVRIVGHIDLRWSSNNTVFKEYTSYLDQKYGGSVMIPSNTTLVGINNADGTPARITGTTLLIGGELPLTAGGDPQADFESWIAAGKDGDQYPTWTRNVIIRNISLDTPWDVNPEDSGNAYADGMTISRTQNLWLDHMSMSDGNTPDSLASDTRHDGLVDVVRGSDYVTISNNYFTEHHKTTLVGNGDSGRAWSDDGRMHVTFTGMWWDSLGSRLPLNRYGQVHLYNNLITGSTSTSNADLKFGSGSDARYHSNMLVQNNYYAFTGLKLSEACGKVIMGKDYIAFRSSGHLFTSDKADTTLNIPAGAITAWDGQCSMTAPTGSDVWTPPYSYTLVTADVANTNVRANAGAGKLK